MLTDAYRQNLKNFVEHGIREHNSRAAFAAHISKQLPAKHKISSQLLGNWQEAEKLRHPLKEDSLWKIGVALGIPASRRQVAEAAALSYLKEGLLPDEADKATTHEELAKASKALEELDDSQYINGLKALVKWCSTAPRISVTDAIPYLAKATAIAANRVYASTGDGDVILTIVRHHVNRNGESKKQFLERSGLSSKQLDELLESESPTWDDDLLEKVADGLDRSVRELEGFLEIIVPPTSALSL